MRRLLLLMLVAGSASAANQMPATASADPATDQRTIEYIQVAKQDRDAVFNKGVRARTRVYAIGENQALPAIDFHLEFKQ